MAGKKLAGWKNRIVGHEDVDPRSLLANPDNYKVHSQLQERGLSGAIDDVGFLRSVTVNKRTGRLVDGHLRVALAVKTKQATITVEYVDLSPAEERTALATLDPLGAMAAGDSDKIDSLLKKIGADSSAADLLRTMGASPEEESETKEISFKRGVAVKVGPHKFTIPTRKFARWLKELPGDTDADYQAEIKRRLGFTS
jgi:ParB-like chromosome segregation protein Spo0J